MSPLVPSPPENPPFESAATPDSSPPPSPPHLSAALPPPPPSEESSPPAQSGSELPPMPPHPYPGSIPNLDAIIGGARGIAPTLPPPSHSRTAVLKSKRPTMEQVDERCWIRSRQTNARRALGREPAVSMYCYLNFRHSLADLVPVPGSPNSFIARDAAPGTNASGSVDLKGKGKEVDKPEGLPDYYWPRLDGRYLYIARGREAIARHMKEMGGVAAEPSGEEGAFTVSRKSGDEEKVGAWNTIARIEERCEKLEAERALPGKRQEQMVKRAMGLDEDDSERLVSLSTLYSTTLQRLHTHILRIYTPGLTALAKLPSTFTDGTQLQMLETVGTRLTDGSAFTLAKRLGESLVSVQGQLSERRKRNGGGGGEGGGGGFGVGGALGGFGGTQPPIPPRAVEGNDGADEGEVVPPSPPRPAVPPAEEGGEGKPELGGEKEDGHMIRGPGGKMYPPGTRFISCAVM